MKLNQPLGEQFVFVLGMYMLSLKLLSLILKKCLGDIYKLKGDPIIVVDEFL